MKNVCFVINDITTVGGTEKMTSLVSNGLSESKNYNIYIYSLCKKNLRPFFNISTRVKVIYKKTDCKKFKPLKLIDNAFSIFNFLLRYKIDIIIDVDVCLDLYSVLPKIVLNRKLISWDHYSFNEKNPYFTSLNRARKISSRFSNAIVPLTNSYREEYLSRYKVKSKIDVIYNPFNSGYNNEYDKKSKILLTVGRLSEEKGIKYIPQIASKIFHDFPDWKWYILGEGNLKEYLVDELDKLGLNDNVILKGFKKNTGDYYKKSAIYVLPSYDECLSLVVLEAKSYSLPVVSFNISGSNEIVRNDIDGYLIDNYDVDKMAGTIKDLMNDLDKRILFSANTKSNLNLFSIDTIIDKWKNLIDNI